MQRRPIIHPILFLFQIHSFQKILQTFPVSKEDEGMVLTAIQVLLIIFPIFILIENFQITEIVQMAPLQHYWKYLTISTLGRFPFDGNATLNSRKSIIDEWS